MAAFQIPIERPEEIVPRLGKPELHWKKGRSAFELSHAWMNAKGIPASARSVLDQALEWRDAKLLDAIFERSTALPGRGLASQTDLLGIVSLKDGNAILSVEGKVDEPFGEVVGEWVGGPRHKEAGEAEGDFQARRERSQKNRVRRLDALCSLLEVDAKQVAGLYYQLFHRTCAAVYEAQRFRYPSAMMLVHSFAGHGAAPETPLCFNEFKSFTEAVGMPVPVPESVSMPKRLGGVELRLGWVSDEPCSLPNQRIGASNRD